MSSIVIAGDTSGSVTLQAPATAGTTVLTLPSTSGTLAIGSGALVLLSTVTASNSATVDVETTFDSTYDVYKLIISGLTVVSNGDTLMVRMKIGGTYLTTATYVYHHSVPTSVATTYAGTASNSDDAVYLASVGNAANRSANYEITIFNPSSTAFSKSITWHGTTIRSGDGYATNSSGGAHNTGTAALTGIRIMGLSGNILAGKFRLYGLANS
jgi:hypothetical protein